MTWEELIEWAKTQGKTETDVIRWFAQSEVQSIKDMADEEMIDWLIEGVKYDRAYVESLWLGLEAGDQNDYLVYMTDSWTGE